MPVQGVSFGLMTDTASGIISILGPTAPPQLFCGPGNLDHTQSVTITVDEDNTAPVLATVADQTVTEGATVQFTADDDDVDLPAQSLAYSLDAGAPTDAAIDPVTGEFSWTTAEADRPGVYTITVRVTDDGPGSATTKSPAGTLHLLSSRP